MGCLDLQVSSGSTSLRGPLVGGGVVGGGAPLA